MDIRIDKTKVEKTLASLAGRIAKPARFLMTWGNSVAKSARAKARGKGGKRFWARIARNTRVYEVSDETVAVGVEGEELGAIAAHKQLGGEIKAKNKRALTIPITEEAKGKTVAEFEMGGRPLFTVPGSDPRTIGILGYSAHGEFFPQFALRTRTKRQAADPWFPDNAEVTALGMKEAEFWINREMKEAAG